MPSQFRPRIECVCYIPTRVSCPADSIEVFSRAAEKN